MIPERADIAIVGAGAAGLATAIFARRAHPARSVLLVDGARRPGAKILVSGGTRCNVSNSVVSERDFWGGRHVLTRRVLRAFTAADAVVFFRDLGVPLHEEAGGKLFPDSQRARDVLEALLQGVERAGARLYADCRVLGITATPDGFRLQTTRGEIVSASAVLATGGLSLPKSGSDGAGLTFAATLGHTIVPTTPALAPLLLTPSASPMHRDLSGVSHVVELTVWIGGTVSTRLTGSLLWTHFGISGPAALDASRHWLRAAVDDREAAITANFCPGETFETLDRRWTAMAASHPRTSVLSALGSAMPGSLAAALLDRLSVAKGRTLATLTRADRRALVHAVVAWPLPVQGSRGYTHAEATAGGVALDEVNVATMESRKRRGLYLVGEMLDVDGRIGGFNFQWAWSSAYVAGRALGRSTATL